MSSVGSLPWLETGSVHRLRQALDLRALRQAAITENVANVETDGFAARDVLFEESMRSGPRGDVGLQRTHERHLRPAATDPRPRWQQEGTVDLVVEMARLQENAAAYKSAAAILRSQLDRLHTAASDGRR
jgi:flagellar basal-body rod protein FlgB